MGGIRERLGRLDERAGLTNNKLPGWLAVLVSAVLVALIIIGIVRSDQEVILFAGIVLGLFLAWRWRTTPR